MPLMSLSVDLLRFHILHVIVDAVATLAYEDNLISTLQFALYTLSLNKCGNMQFQTKNIER